MKSWRPLVSALVLFSLLATPAAARDGDAAPAVVFADSGEPQSADAKKEAAEPPRHASDRVIVRWKDAGRTSSALRRHGLSAKAALHAPHTSLVATNGRSVADVVAELSHDPDVAWVEPDYEIHVMGGPDDATVSGVAVNDALTNDQYSLDRMWVRDAWAISTGASNVIAVLDTGVWAGHQDLAGKLVSGYDFVNDDTNAADDNAHGTWVAGIIAARVNDGYGVAGISWSDKIMPVKVMNANGSGYTSDLVDGIRWAADHGADIINMSIGGYAASSTLHEAIKYAYAKDVVLVGAAGNNRIEQSHYPASFPEVISVSATQADDEFTNWSNYGPLVDVSAPGASVLTTNCDRNSVSSCMYAGRHIVISGTSFASPNVAGVAALVRARYPDWSNAQVMSRIISTADDLGFSGWDKRYGHGRVNATRALGGSTAKPAASPGDWMEGNNTLASAQVVGLNQRWWPSIHPAGDIDVFAFDVPRPGRLDITVGAVVDTTRVAKSALPIDPVLHIYGNNQHLIKTVDDPGSGSTTERTSIQITGAGRIYLRVANWLPNGNRQGYLMENKFVDNVAPAMTSRVPAPNASDVRFDQPMTITFSEAVSGVSASSVVLRKAGSVVPASVTYSSSARRATLTPSAPLAGDSAYSLSVTTAIKDVAGNSLPAQSWSFTTGKSPIRLAGADRYATAATISKFGFSAGIPVAYLATGAGFPDALAGGALAGKTGGPILLVTNGTLPPATAAELDRLNPDTIVVLGGKSAVSDAVLNAAKGYATGGSVTRLHGADRYATAAAVSKHGFAEGVPVAYVATGTGFPDALAGGPLAARTGGPILLVTRTTVPAATAAELARLKPAKIVVLGGSTAVSDAVLNSLKGYAGGGNVTRLAGADRFATAAKVSASRWLADGPDTVLLATGSAFADALAGGAYGGLLDAPLLLTGSGALPPATAAELARLNPTRVIILGGSGAVNDGILLQVHALFD
ncbi:MAG TPA: cell wall-binding repeat-containing protein [Candidatus Limnocylindria bacterium]|nr:cell wall-binding repeat-containing protein [Candidatus Limnocylindria bacterium]